MLPPVFNGILQDMKYQCDRFILFCFTFMKCEIMFLSLALRYNSSVLNTVLHIYTVSPWYINNLLTKSTTQYTAKNNRFSQRSPGFSSSTLQALFWTTMYITVSQFCNTILTHPASRKSHCWVLGLHCCHLTLFAATHEISLLTSCWQMKLYVHSQTPDTCKVAENIP